jgi:hypothetical protein
MNPMNQLLKKHGLKVALPLLLLTTACGGEGTSSSLQSDSIAPVSPELAAAATPSSGFTANKAPDAGLTPPDVKLPPKDDKSTPPVLPPAGVNPTPGNSGTTKVPEPTAVMGLAIAAAGMVVIKRKQAAA